MNSKIRNFLFVLAMIAGFAAAKAEEPLPLITFHTTIYETYGAENDFSLLIGGSADGVGNYIDVDCGFGTSEYELESANSSTDESGEETQTGTYIACRVSEEGVVKIYCDDPSWIDWINFSGCYIDQIDLGQLTNLTYLNLCHNELKSLDLTDYPTIQALYLTDNAFSESPLVIGAKQNLSILEINSVGNLSSDFTLTDYPSLYSFDAWGAQGLTTIDASNCPNLVKLSIDGTDVSSMDISQCPNLSILNVSDTRLTSLDLSNSPNLVQLYCTHESYINSNYKISSLDLSNCPNLYYLFCTGNDLTELDLSNNPALGSITARKNLLTSIDVSDKPNLFCLNISDNYFDFVTLPEPDDNWTEYGYAQRDIVCDKSYPVGAVLDYSSKLNRQHTTTEGFMYGVNEESPLEPYVISDDCYSYVDGVVTIKSLPKSTTGVVPDSVYVQFTNSLFTEAALKTQVFKVKSADEYGKPNLAFSMTSAAYSGLPVKFNVGIFGASATEPKTFYVDFGDGTMTECTATSSDDTFTNVDGISTGSGQIKVYVAEGDDVSALAIDDLTLYSIDLSNLRSMHTLSLVNTELYSLNLDWNRSLVNLTLYGNHLPTFSLASDDNQAYAKNALINVDLTNNEISTFTWNENFTVENLNLSHNNISSLSLSKNTKIQSIDISFNDFEYFNAADCSALTSLNVAHNQLSEISLPTESVLTELILNDNLFTLASLPKETEDFVGGHYVYAPQTDYSLPKKGPGANLSSQALDNTTNYVWKTTAGTALTEGVDYTMTTDSEGNIGRFSFINTSVGNIYCEMTNEEFPQFTGDNIYKTTPIEAAEMPTNVIATFVTANDGEDVNLTLTSLTPNNSVFVDWTGENDLTQYELATSYRNFTATTKANATVKVYSYDNPSGISVFSLRGATLKSMDASAMTQLICFNVTNGGLEEITYPESPNLGELILQGNKLTDFDFTKFPSVYYLNLADNGLTEIEVPANTNLQQLFLSSNELTDVTINQNTKLWSLYLDNNQLTDIDLSGVPNLSQTTLANNLLTNIDLSGVPNLRVLSLVGNRFTFATLPVPGVDYDGNVFYYGNQENLDVTVENGVVDLSDQAFVDGTATIYTWIIGEPDYDEDDNLVNEVLDGESADPEYTNEDGVITFLYSQQQIVCLMTNDIFENLTLQTNPISVTGFSGVDNVNVDSNAYIKVIDNAINIFAAEGQEYFVYDIAGRTVANGTTNRDVTVVRNLTPATYIVTLPSQVAKVCLK